MKIIGFRLVKVSAERYKPINGQINIKSGINIEDISKEETNITEKGSLKFDFAFTIEYSEFAKVELKGAIIAIDDKEESKDILKEWKKKEFKHPVKIPLFNFIMDKCNLKSLQLEEELGLPLHIPFPKVAPKTKED